MILIGQYDSPFVRRVGIALRLYGLPFDHRPWSTFSDADALRGYNPLTRVPTLILDDGSVLVDSHMMLDYLDSRVPEDQAMFPAREPDRHRVLKTTALAMGLAEKAVSLFYERRMHDTESPVWAERCRRQIGSVLEALEKERGTAGGEYWFGARISHADIGVACALRFVRDVHDSLFDPVRYPALAHHADRMEAMPVFREISQPFIPPA